MGILKKGARALPRASAHRLNREPGSSHFSINRTGRKPLRRSAPSWEFCVEPRQRDTGNAFCMTQFTPRLGDSPPEHAVTLTVLRAAPAGLCPSLPWLRMGPYLRVVFVIHAGTMHDAGDNQVN